MFKFSKVCIWRTALSSDNYPMIPMADSEGLDQGPVVRSIISLMSSLVVKMLTVLVSTMSNSHVFLLKICE